MVWNCWGSQKGHYLLPNMDSTVGSLSYLMRSLLGSLTATDGWYDSLIFLDCLPSFRYTFLIYLEFSYLMPACWAEDLRSRPSTMWRYRNFWRSSSATGTYGRLLSFRFLRVFLTFYWKFLAVFSGSLFYEYYNRF